MESFQEIWSLPTNITGNKLTCQSQVRSKIFERLSDKIKKDRPLESGWLLWESKLLQKIFNGGWRGWGERRRGMRALYWDLQVFLPIVYNFITASFCLFPRDITMWYINDKLIIHEKNEFDLSPHPNIRAIKSIYLATRDFDYLSQSLRPIWELLILASYCWTMQKQKTESKLSTRD